MIKATNVIACAILCAYFIGMALGYGRGDIAEAIEDIPLVGYFLGGWFGFVGLINLKHGN